MKHASAVLFLLVSGGFAWAAEPTPAPNDSPIELPKFVVTDSRELPPPESWRYATMPGFEILTNASDKATQRLMRDFDMFRQALGQVWPMPNRVTAPCYLIICGRGAKFDAFEPENKYDSATARASLFLKKGTQSAIVIDFQATTLNVLNVDDSNDAATGTDSGIITVEHDKQLYREYVHYLLSRSEPRMPAWFEEGIAQIVMRMKFDKRWIEFAKLEDPNTISTQAGMVLDLNAASAAAGGADDAALPGAPAEDRDFNVALQRKALVAWDKFFAVEHDAPEALNPLGNNRWAKQAYAFVHMCLYGYKGKYQKAFGNFIVRAAREPVTEAMFKDCFKMSYKELGVQLRSYCDFTVYDSKEYRAKEDVILPPPPLALRDATQSEVGRLKGETLALAGHERAARTELIAPYIRGERDPQLLASLGLWEHNAGQDDRARKFLDAAVAQKEKPVRPEAYLELARFRYADALAAAGAEGRFNATQVKSVVDPLLVARTQPPPLAAVYELMADTWARSANKPTREEITPLVAGAQQNPTRLKLIYQTAALCGEAGWVEAAHAFADHGIKVAPDANVKARFEQLKATLPPAPPKPAAAEAGAKKT